MEYIDAKQDFYKEDFLYHFTSFEALKTILNSGKFRLSRISNLNDSKESKYINPFFDGKVFTFSLTKTIKEYFWDNYTQGFGKEGGIIIQIKNIRGWYESIVTKDGNAFQKVLKSNIDYKSYNQENDWGIYDISCLKVIYKDYPENDFDFDNETYEIYKDCKLFDNSEQYNRLININNQGYVKESIWSEEDEYRIRIIMRPKGVEEILGIDRNVIPKFPSNFIYLDISNKFHLINILISKDFLYKDELNYICRKYGITYFEID